MASGDTLMALWLHNKSTTRPIDEIVEEAQAGKLPGVEPLPSGHGFRVVDEEQALTAMRR